MGGVDITRTIAAIIAIGLTTAGCTPPKAAEPPASNNLTAAAPAPAASSREDPVPDAEVIKSVPLVNLAPEGLSFVDSASGKSRMIEYGVSRDVIETAATAALGNPSERGHSRECGAGALDYTTYANGLQLVFQDGSFSGWTVKTDPKKNLTTASGIGIGSTRAELSDAYDIDVDETSLGTQFSAETLSGLLDGKGPKAKITDIWAGTICIID